MKDNSKNGKRKAKGRKAAGGLSDKPTPAALFSWGGTHSDRLRAERAMIAANEAALIERGARVLLAGDKPRPRFAGMSGDNVRCRDRDKREFVLASAMVDWSRGAAYPPRESAMTENEAVAWALTVFPALFAKTKLAGGVATPHYTLGPAVRLPGESIPVYPHAIGVRPSPKMLARFQRASMRWRRWSVRHAEEPTPETTAAVASYDPPKLPAVARGLKPRKAVKR